MNTNNKSSNEAHSEPLQQCSVSSRNIFIMEERKQKLIEALKSERLRFAERGQDTTEHDIAIQFLLLGKTSCNPDKWELLDAVMNDFDTVCSDYGCQTLC